MSKIRFQELAIPSDNPPAGRVILGVDIADGELYIKDSSGTVTKYAPVGGTAWGTITGTLSSQTDLQSELNGKEDTLGTPASNGYILSSTTGDVRSWVDPESINPKGVESFYQDHRGEVGIGTGWADTGLIGNLPVLFFNQSSTEKATYSFYISSRMVLTTINPQVSFNVFSIGAPSGGADAIRWELKARYVANTEKPTAAAAETLLQTQTLVTYTTDTRQSSLVFTLNKALISDQDMVLLSLSRLGADAADTYSGDVAVGKAGLIIETLSRNP